MGLLIGWIIGCGLIKFIICIIKLIFNLIKLIFYIVIILCGAIYKAVQVLFKLCKNSYRLVENHTYRNNEHTGHLARIVLTIAHLDHTPEHCNPDNLRALCQRCHNRYDAEHRKETRLNNKNSIKIKNR